MNGSPANTQPPLPSLIRRRHLALLLCSVVAGLLCALMSLLSMDWGNILRSVILALCLSLGVVWINRASAAGYAGGEGGSPKTVAGVGLATGLLAGLLMLLVNLVSGSLDSGARMDFRMPTPGVLTTLLAATCYGLALQWAYALRWRFRSRSGLKAFLMICLAGYLCGLIRVGTLVLAEMDTEDLAMQVSGWLMAGLFVGLPFAMLWAAVVAISDPAWSLARWQRLGGGGEASAEREL